MRCERREFDAAFGGARRDEEKSRAKERVFSFRDALGQWDPEEPAAGALEPLQRPRRQGREHPRVPALQLDRDRRLAVHPPGEHSRRAALLRQRAPDGRARRDAACPLEHDPPLLPGENAATGAVPHALARLHLLHRRHPLERGHGAEDHRGTDAVPPVRSGRTGSSTTTRKARWR